MAVVRARAGVLDCWNLSWFALLECIKNMKIQIIENSVKYMCAENFQNRLKFDKDIAKKLKGVVFWLT